MSFTANMVILVPAMGASLVFTFVVNRLWPVDRRYAANDQVGWQRSVLGTSYAVTLGFMLYPEWGDFKTAEFNVELEASELAAQHRSARPRLAA